MKTKQLIVMSVLAIAGLTSCEKDLYDPTQETKESKLEDLIVPADFDWKMTRNATCDVISDHAVTLSIYQDEVCSEGNLLATIPLRAGAKATLPLSILKSASNVYVQYENTAGKKVTVAAPVVNGKINVTAPADSKQPTTTRAAGDTPEAKGATLYYPTKAGGFILFEDNYPSQGDYDFNDFVGDYNIEVTTDENSQNSEYVKSVKFTMTTLAIGGTNHCVPCVRLPWKTTQVKEYTAKILGKLGRPEKPMGDIMKADKVNGKGHAVFVLSGVENKDLNIAAAESPFLNTEKDHITRDLYTVELMVTFKEGEFAAHISDVPADSFYDIFLINESKDQKEIHLAEYGPAFLDDSFFLLSEHSNVPVYKQPNEKNSYLVWAIHAPKGSGEVTYPIEKMDITSAFPKFQEWVTNGVTNWYSEPNKDYTITMQ